MFKLPCIVSFESLHGSDWPLFNKRFTVTVGCTWCCPLSRLNGVMQRLKTHLWVRKIKTKKYCKIPENYPVKREKKRKKWKNEVNRWTRCGKIILKKGKIWSNKIWSNKFEYGLYFLLIYHYWNSIEIVSAVKSCNWVCCIYM